MLPAPISGIRRALPPPYEDYGVVSETTAQQWVLEVLEALNRDGSPVAGTTPEERDRVARLAVRRLRSFNGRTKIRQPTDDDRVDDLAKGLRDQLEFDPRLAGRLIEDYRHLARRVVEAEPNQS